jgi:GTP-binding protein EngB required for normal cell division
MANKKITTLKLELDTKKRLEKLKTHRKDTFDDILKNILRILSITKSNPVKAKVILKKIDKIQKRLNAKSLDEELDNDSFINNE